MGVEVGDRSFQPVRVGASPLVNWAIAPLVAA
jgi:hypothetical protein